MKTPSPQKRAVGAASAPTVRRRRRARRRERGVHATPRERQRSARSRLSASERRLRGLRRDPARLRAALLACYATPTPPNLYLARCLGYDAAGLRAVAQEGWGDGVREALARLRRSGMREPVWEPVWAPDDVQDV